jgi:hypothetical protein
MIGWIAVAVCCAISAASDGAQGVIGGTIVNGSQGRSPVAGVKVVLRAEVEGSLIPIAETTSDDLGRFEFAQLDGARDLVCLPGANYQGIHYPGRRVSGIGLRPIAAQTIAVYETVAEPSPLIVARHEMDVRSEVGVLVVSETMIVDNRSLKTYVGSETTDGQTAATLRLSIPPEFEKVTFAKEFFGRQFQLNGETVETHIPWTPGQRELKFTYRLPVEHRDWLFSRPLDLPTEHFQLRISGDQIDEVSCNLALTRTTTENTVVFTSAAALPPGHIIEVRFGDLPVDWAAYARWVALASLALLVLATYLYTRLSRRKLEPAVVNEMIERRSSLAKRAA